MHGDVAKLQPNFWVNNFMTLLRMQGEDKTSKPFLCENCDSEDQAVSRCNDCSVFMCDFCVTAHKRFLATRGHQILSMAEVQKLGSKALAKPSFCVKHTGEALKLFCETCQETICRDCTIVDHREHKYNFVADVAEGVRKDLHSSLSKAKDKEIAVSEGLETVEAMKKLVQSKVSEVNKEVDEFFDEQVKALEHQRSSLKREVMTEGKARVDKLEKQSHVLSYFLAQLKSSLKFTSHALDDSDDVQLLTMKKQLSRRLTQLNSAKIECKASQNEYFRLCVRQTIFRDVKELATVRFILNPQMFTVSIVGGDEGVMYRTLAGQTVSLVVTNKDKEAERGEYHVAASVAKTGEDEQSLPVLGNGDGSYTFSYCSKSEGSVTLSVTVDGQPVGGSPFQWEVYPVLPICDEPKTMPGLLRERILYEGETTHGNCFKDGRYCWKVRVGDFASYRRRFEFGVTTERNIYYNRGIQTWSLSVEGSGFQRVIRSDHRRGKEVSIKRDDVFTVFLNLEKETLSMYNNRSKTTEVFEGVKGPLMAITQGVAILWKE